MTMSPEEEDHFDQFQSKETVICDVEGAIVVYSLKARKIIFRKAIDHLIMEYDYPENLQELRYESAYMNGSFYLHNFRCIFIDDVSGEHGPEFYHGLLNIKQSRFEAELRPGEGINNQEDYKPLRSCLEASLIAAVFERIYRWTSKDARDIYETCLIPTAGTIIRRKLIGDCRAALNYVIYECGELRRAIISNPSLYLDKSEMCLEFLKDSKHLKHKKLVIKSEYDYKYTNAMMRYAFDDPLWYQRFDVVAVKCGPYWLDAECADKFIQLDEYNGDVVDRNVTKLCKGGVYCKGSVEELFRLLGRDSQSVAYITADASAGVAVAERDWILSVLQIPTESCPTWESRVGRRPLDLAEPSIAPRKTEKISPVYKAKKTKKTVSSVRALEKIVEEAYESVWEAPKAKKKEKNVPPTALDTITEDEHESVSSIPEVDNEELAVVEAAEVPEDESEDVYEEDSEYFSEAEPEEALEEEQEDQPEVEDEGSEDESMEAESEQERTTGDDKDFEEEEATIVKMDRSLNAWDLLCKYNPFSSSLLCSIIAAYVLIIGVVIFRYIESSNHS